MCSGRCGIEHDPVVGVPDGRKEFQTAFHIKGNDRSGELYFSSSNGKTRGVPCAAPAALNKFRSILEQFEIFTARRYLRQHHSVILIIPMKWLWSCSGRPDTRSRYFQGTKKHFAIFMELCTTFILIQA